jgi:DNA-binding LacI/PurR family transcriptional regulator
MHSIRNGQSLAGPDPQESCDTIDYARAEVARLALDYLIDAGCRRLAHLGPDDDRGIAFENA